MVENVIWPAYLDADRSRREGRRVSLDIAVPAPTVEEIAAAAEQIGYAVRIEPEKQYPRDYEGTGCVVVEGVEDASKNDLVQAVAAYVAAMRDQSE